MILFGWNTSERERDFGMEKPTFTGKSIMYSPRQNLQACSETHSASYMKAKLDKSET
jgi:hypothetical protein